MTTFASFDFDPEKVEIIFRDDDGDITLFIGSSYQSIDISRDLAEKIRFELDHEHDEEPVEERVRLALAAHGPVTYEMGEDTEGLE